MDEKANRRALKKSMDDWCVNRGTMSAFCETAAQRALKYHGQDKTPNPIDCKELADCRLPDDLHEAIRYVLTKHLEGIRDLNPLNWKETIDKLGLHFEPKFHGRDWATQEKKMILHRNFRGIADEDLNPFTRFSYKRYTSAADYVAATWDPDCVGGHIMEAVVAHFVEQNQTECLWCETRGNLRWNGGSSATSAWVDVVCVECQASYEIKSRHDKEAVEKQMYLYDTMRGGSFVAFTRFQRRLEKHYVLVVPRLADLRGSHPIYVAMIDKVLPKLTSDSFDLEDMDYMSIGSEIHLKAVFKPGSGKQRTLGVATGYDAQRFFDTINEVFDHVFGVGEWKARVPTKEAWCGSSRLFFKEPISNLVSSFRGLDIGSSSTTRAKSYTRTLVGNTARKTITIGPSYDPKSHHSHQGLSEPYDNDNDSHERHYDHYGEKYDRKQQRRYNSKSRW